MDVVLPPLADPVGEALHFLRISGTFYCRSELTAPFALELPAMNRSLMLHVATAGSFDVEVEGLPRRTVGVGDLVLVPHGRGHVMSSGPDIPATPLFDAPRVQSGERYEHLRLGGGGEAASAICVLFQFDHPAAEHLTRMLPGLIVVDACQSADADWVRSALRLMAAESRELRPGGETVITRLADILVIHAVRCWIEQDDAARTGWLGALRDPRIGRIIGRIHREPERPWTLESLGAEAAMSRSAFAARFTELVGEPAMQYVTRWRMMTALSWLREDGSTVGEIARRLSYESEAAFNRAFKRFLGVTPGAARRTRAVNARATERLVQPRGPFPHRDARLTN